MALFSNEDIKYRSNQNYYKMEKTNIYIHDPSLAYPDRDFVHMVKAEKVHDFTYDESFPYRMNDSKTKFVRFWFRVVIFLIVKPFCYIRYLLRIKGKKHYREYKRLAGKKGMITICNHTTEWDILFVMTSRPFHFCEFPIWQEGAESKSGYFYRYTGGIVLPTLSYKGMNYAYEKMKDVVKEGKWLHVFPEAACWAFYPALRPFRIGTFKLAVELDMPILPMVVKYRKPNALYRLFKKHPNASLLIGSPVMPDYNLVPKERAEDMCQKCREIMMSLLGLDEKSNQDLIDSLPKYHEDSKTLFKKE